VRSLAFLGVQALRAGWRGRGCERSLSEPPPLDARSAFRQGLTSNALNPKIAVFFTSLLPQFLSHGSSTLLGLLALGALFNLLGVVWLAAYAIAAARGRAMLQRPRVKAFTDYLSGTVLVVLGVRLAFERRP
jgi:threonine/homoserine/homoserine lactone efflux protein